MNSLNRSKVSIAVFMVVLLLIDQLSKIYIKTSMTINEAIYVFGDWFQIRFIENFGAAYGFELGGDYGKMALSLIRVVLTILLIFYINSLIKKGAPKKVIFSFVLILAGAVGNLIDSMFYGMIFSESTTMDVANYVGCNGGGYSTFLHGAVVDMLYVPIIDTTLPEWLPLKGGDRFIFFSPIFNVADSYVSIGFIYLILFCRKYFK